MLKKTNRRSSYWKKDRVYKYCIGEASYFIGIYGTNWFNYI